MSGKEKEKKDLVRARKDTKAGPHDTGGGKSLYKFLEKGKTWKGLRTVSK